MFESIKRYSTFIDRTNPLTKIVAAICLFIAVVLIHDPNHLFHLSLWMLLLFLAMSGIELKYQALLIAVTVLTGLVSSAYMILYGEGDTTLFEFGLVHITEESIVRGLHITMRGLTLSFFGSLIIFTTRLTDVFYSMMQQAKVKPKYAYSFMASIRMLPVIVNEFITLRRARKVRRSLISRKHIGGLRGFTSTVVILLSQSIRRAHRLAVAMESKGFDDGARTYYRQTRFSGYDVCFIALIAVGLIASYYSGQWITPFGTSDAR